MLSEVKALQPFHRHLTLAEDAEHDVRAKSYKIWDVLDGWKDVTCGELDLVASGRYLTVLQQDHKSCNIYGPIDDSGGREGFFDYFRFLLSIIAACSRAPLSFHH